MATSSSSNKDAIYATRLERVGDFVFDDQVAQVFPDMISRSVPGYASILAMTGLLAAEHADSGSHLYDLGCSLGASTLAMQTALTGRDCRLVAVDNAPAMLERAQQACAAVAGAPIEFLCSDIRDVPIENAAVVVLNFTLQFVPPDDRLALLARIRSGMRPKGVLILSEKIQGATAEEDQLLVEMHHAFKRANGYSALEISQKRAALENVLLPETLATHQQRLREAGFSQVQLWFQCFNFVSLVALP